MSNKLKSIIYPAVKNCQVYDAPQKNEVFYEGFLH